MQAVCLFFPSSPLSFSNMAPGRGDCLPNETAVKNSQCLSALSPPLFYLTPSHLPTPLAERKRDGGERRPYLLSVGSSQVLSDGRTGRWGSSRGSGRRGKKEWWIKQRKASLFLTGSRRERRGGTTDYLMMEERGWWWEPDTCGGVFREGSPARKKVTICCSHRRWRQESLQPGPKMLMGAPCMHIKRTSAREAAFAFWLHIHGRMFAVRHWLASSLKAVSVSPPCNAKASLLFHYCIIDPTFNWPGSMNAPKPNNPYSKWL